MQILDEGTPLTNLEAFAILRRNRDMRYAKGLPPFGVQSRAPPSGSAPPPFPTNRRFENNAASARDASLRAAQDFHLQNAVALHEVQGLFYLRNVCLMNRIAVQQDMTTSVYSAAFKPKIAGHKQAHAQKAGSKKVDNEEASTTCSASIQFAAIRQFDVVGTKSHVVTVNKELEFLERMERHRELEFISKLKATMVHWNQEQLQSKRLSSPSKAGNSAAASDKLMLAPHEVRALVNMRPQSVVEVAALLPGLENRVDADAVETVSLMIAEVFAQV